MVALHVGTKPSLIQLTYCIHRLTLLQCRIKIKPTPKPISIPARCRMVPEPMRRIRPNREHTFSGSRYARTTMSTPSTPSIYALQIYPHIYPPSISFYNTLYLAHIFISLSDHSHSHTPNDAVGPCAHSLLAAVTPRHGRRHFRQARWQQPPYRRKQRPLCCRSCHQRRRKRDHRTQPIRDQHT